MVETYPMCRFFVYTSSLSLQLESDVVKALNDVRRDPLAWANYLNTEIRSRYEGDLMIRVENGQKVAIQTHEGLPALEEAIRYVLLF